MFQYKCGKTFGEVKNWLRIRDEDAKLITEVLYNEGYTERALCYVATIAEDKLLTFIGDSRFASVFINEVRKRAFKKGDERWNNKRQI